MNEQILTIKAALEEQQKLFKENKDVDAKTRIAILKKALKAAIKAQDLFAHAFA